MLESRVPFIKSGATACYLVRYLYIGLEWCTKLQSSRLSRHVMRDDLFCHGAKISAVLENVGKLKINILHLLSEKPKEKEKKRKGGRRGLMTK